MKLRPHPLHPDDGQGDQLWITSRDERNRKLCRELWTIEYVNAIPMTARERKRYDQIDGDCTFSEKRMRVVMGLSERDDLDVHVHETIHAQRPHAREEIVLASASEIAAVLHARGYHIDCGPCSHCGKWRR